MTHSQQTNLLMAGIAAIAVFFATESQAVDINVPKVTIAPNLMAKLPKSVVDLAKIKGPAPTKVIAPVMPRAATTMTTAPALKATSPAVQAALQKIRKVLPQTTPDAKTALKVTQRHNPVIGTVATAVRHVPSGRAVDAKAIERTRQIDKHLLGGKLVTGDLLAKAQIVALPDQVQGKAQRPDPVSRALPERQNMALAGGSSLAALPTVKPVIGIQGVDFATRTVGRLQDPRQQTYEVYNNDPTAIAKARNARISNGSDTDRKIAQETLSTGLAVAEKFDGATSHVGKVGGGVLGAVSAADAIAKDPTQGLIDFGVGQATSLGAATLETGVTLGAAGFVAETGITIGASGAALGLGEAGATVAAGTAGAAVLSSFGAGYAIGKVLDEVIGINEAINEASRPDDHQAERGLNPGSSPATETETASPPDPATGAETAAADTGGVCGVNMSCSGDQPDPDDDGDQSEAGSEDDGNEASESSADASDEEDTGTTESRTDAASDAAATDDEEEEDEGYCGAQQDDCGGPTLTVEEMEAWGIVARDEENWDKTPNPESNPIREIDPIVAEGLMAAATAQKLGWVTTPNPEGGSSAPMPQLTEEERLEFQRQMQEHRLAPLVYPSPMDD